jgi:Cdc6-like AAA superfamily ATPase
MPSNSYWPVSPEVGFTNDVIRDPNRFVGRVDLINDCIKALNTALGVIAIYGKRGVGKSSLVRQVQAMALGDYTVARNAGVFHNVPEHPRQFVTVYYACDSLIKDGQDLLQRLCNDTNDEDGLLRLVPNEGKQLVEFQRSKEVNAGADLKVVSWGTKGIESSKYVKTVPGDIVQTFRNYVSAIVSHQVKSRMKRDGLLIVLDEFDVIADKSHVGSLMKSLSTTEVKFGICGIGRDLADLVSDHASVERLLEEGALHVTPMPSSEAEEIITTAERLFEGRLKFDSAIKRRIAEISQGYPYFVQLLGRECVNQANQRGLDVVDETVFSRVMDDVREGRAFPTLERQYQRAIGNSEGRQFLLHLLAEQPEDRALYNEEAGKVLLKKVRKDAADLNVEFIDQLIPRLIDPAYGPVLMRASERQGVYEFVNPVLRLYVNLRRF